MTRTFWVLMAFGLLLRHCSAHFPIGGSSLPGTCANMLPDLQNSWAVFGVLRRPNQVDTVCFEGSGGDVVQGAIVIPPKAVYAGPNDVTMILLGPYLGRPPIGQDVPDGLPNGAGAQFAEIHPDEGPFPKQNYLGNWYGPRLDVPLLDPATSPYQIRIYSPSGWIGEYILTTTGNDPNAASASLQDTKLPTPGDIDGDGKVTVQDAIRAVQTALGLVPSLSPFALVAGDVAPPGIPDQFIVPGDGVVDLADATRILRRAVGLDLSPDWPDDVPPP